MALTITSRGTGTHNTGATTLVPGGRTATLAAGSMGVFCIAVDNAGGAGDVIIAPTSWTDAKGNVWTRRTSALYDNGAASAGIEMAFYTAPIMVALLTTDLGTITWNTGVSPVAKAWTWYEVIPSGANTVAYSTGGNIAGATAANATVVTASVLVGDGVIAGYFSENVSAVTGDSDTTNGTWAAQQTATIGSTTSGVRIASQQKVQTTTASTQSYDVVVSSQDRIAGYIMLHEVVDTTVTPGVLTQTIATFAPTVTATDQKTVVPALLALVTASFAPTVTATVNQLIVPSLATLATSTFAPTVTTPQTVTPGVVSLTLATLAPTVSVPVLATPGLAALVSTGLAPTVLTPRLVTPATLSLSTGIFAPSVPITDHQRVTAGLATLTLTTFAPTAAVSDNQRVTPGVANLVSTGLAPSIAVSDNQSVVPGVASLITATFAPTIATPVLATPDGVSLATSTFAPSMAISDHKTVVPAVAALTLTTYAPSLSAADDQLARPDTLSLAVSSFAPTVTATDHVRVSPAVVALSVATSAPAATATANVLVVPGTKTLTLSTFKPTIPGKNDDLLAWIIQPVPGYLPVRIVVPPTHLRLTFYPPRVTVIDDGDLMAILALIA
jgi:hypothetical protein